MIDIKTTDLTQTTIRIDSNILNNIKHKCIDLGISRNDFYVSALINELARVENK